MLAAEAHVWTVLRSLTSCIRLCIAASGRLAKVKRVGAVDARAGRAKGYAPSQRSFRQSSLQSSPRGGTDGKPVAPRSTAACTGWLVAGFARTSDAAGGRRLRSNHAWAALRRGRGGTVNL
eukprot:scaffold124194_cov90-Phaeocystis_antarctica.AAC.2